MLSTFLDALGAPTSGDVDPGVAVALLRLVAAWALGGAVAWIYSCTRRRSEVASSFRVTLVLLSILIAMVTQVVGDSIARAFSLVGALSIVRFRTVVRDTQDTAYVIFAVVVGMTIGAGDLWLAVGGVGVVGVAAFCLDRAASDAISLRLSLRVVSGTDVDELLARQLAPVLRRRELLSISAAKQGVSQDVTYEVQLEPGAVVDVVVRDLGGLEGVQSVQVERRRPGLER